MKLSAILVAVVLAYLPSLSVADTLAYDHVYDNASGSLSSVACSDGANGLETRGYTTFGSLPHFPHIGGASAVAGWNSPNCGTCWELTYINASGTAKTIDIIAVDHSTVGFTVAEAAMNELTGGQAVALGRVNVTSKQVNASICGL